MAEETAATPKIKTRKPKQRACDEKDEKGKLCNGHLKRWYEYPKEVAALIGPKAEIYRCEFCKTLYRRTPRSSRRATRCEINCETRQRFRGPASGTRKDHAAKRMDLRLEYGDDDADSSRDARAPG